jgi:hypothetical protein
MSLQKWIDEDGNVVWKESLDGEPEPDGKVIASTPAMTPEPSATSPVGDEHPLQLIPASFERTAPDESVPEAECLPPPTPLWQKETWYRQPMSPVEGLRLLAKRLRENLEKEGRL